MSLKLKPLSMLVYCKPRLLVLSLLLCIFSIFNLLYWIQLNNLSDYSINNDMASIIFCAGSILSIVGTFILFALTTVPLRNKNGKKFGAVFILFGGLMYFAASCFAMTDDRYCNYYFCEIHIFSYTLLPVCTSIALSMDEFFGTFYNSARLRICTYSMILLLSGILFIPYYFQTNIEHNTSEIDNGYDELLNDDNTNKNHFIFTFNISSAFAVIWICVVLSCLLMIVFVGICNKMAQKHIISWISSLLMCAGSAVIVASYAMHSYDNTHFQNDDINTNPLTCYYLLVCAECWIVAIDGVVGNRFILQDDYEKI